MLIFSAYFLVNLIFIAPAHAQTNVPEIPAAVKSSAQDCSRHHRIQQNGHPVFDPGWEGCPAVEKAFADAQWQRYQALKTQKGTVQKSKSAADEVARQKMLAVLKTLGK